MVHSVAQEGSDVPTEGHDAPVLGWQPIMTAPRDGTAIQARIPGHGDDNLIAFEYIGDCGEPDGCAAWGWTFVTDQEPPADWTDGWCWAVNEDGVQSTLPTHWKATPALPDTQPETPSQSQGDRTS